MRQAFLMERRSIPPDIKQGIYPLKDVKPSRADVEWLLATHENGIGAVDWKDESQRKREGLDWRGADLRQEDLSKESFCDDNADGCSMRFPGFSLSLQAMDTSPSAAL